MSLQLTYTLYLAGVFLLLFAAAEWMYHKLNVPAETTRKFVHLFTGIISLLFPILIRNHWYVLLLCSSFLILLLVSLKFGFLPSINRVERKTRGSILYPIVVYGCYLAYIQFGDLSFYYIPLLILACCDPLAGLAGRKWPLGKYTVFGHTKTLTGSVFFFFLAFAICAAFLADLDGLRFAEVLIPAMSIAFITTILEAVTHNGYDNLTIPGGAVLILLIFNEWIYPV